MKTTLTNAMHIQKPVFLSSALMFLLFPLAVLSNTCVTPENLNSDSESAKAGKQNVNTTAETTTATDGDILVMEPENACVFSYDTKGNAIFVKLFKSRIGDYLQYTQIPLKWFMSHQKNEHANADPGQIPNNGWESNISFDMSAGFLNDKSSRIPGQYFALSGHLNRFSVGIILILTA